MGLVKVRCTFVIEVEIPDDPDYNVEFDLVENHCPGTGIVGAALEKYMKACEERSVCWACGLDGECELVS
jgi:hypothetical protein